MNAFYLYTCTCIITGKVYIGRTLDPETRKSEFFNFSQPYAGRKINKARAQLSEPAFWDWKVVKKVSVPKNVDLKIVMDQMEDELIKEHNSLERGYNTRINRSEAGVLIEKI